MATTSMGRLVMTLASNDSEFRKGLKKTLQHAERSLKRASASFGRIGRQLSLSLTAPLAALGVASVKAFATQEAAEAKLRAALKASGQEAEKNLKRFKETASAIQRVTTVGDELSISLAATATAMGINAEQLEATVKGAIGLSKAFEMDTTTSIKAAAAALQGKTELLTRYIPTLSQVEGAQAKVAFVSQKMAEGFAIAKAEAQTTAGRLQQMKNDAGDLMEMIGRRLAPSVTKLARKLQEIVLALSRVNPAFLDMGIKMGVILALTGPLAIGLSAILNIMSKMVALKFVTVATAIAGLTVAAGALAEGFRDAKSEFSGLAQTGKATGSVFGKIAGVIANVFHSARIAIVVAGIGILNAIGGIATGWNAMTNAMGTVFDAMVNGVVFAMTAVVNGFRTKIFPLINAVMKALKDMSAFLPGDGISFTPLSTTKIDYIPREPMGGKENTVGQAFFDQANELDERLFELQSSFPGAAIEAAMNGIGGSLEKNLGPEKIEPATKSNLDLKAAVNQVSEAAKGAGAAGAGMGKDLTEGAGVAVRAFTGLRAAIEDVGLGLRDAAAGQETLRQQTESYATTFADRLGGMLTGASDQFRSFGDVARSVLQDIANELVTGGIKDLLGGLGGGGGGGLLSGIAGIVGSLFGGGKANGGRVSGSKAYLVGERGPEMFVPDAGGQVIPNNRLLAGQSGEGSSSIVVNQNFESGVDEGRLAVLARQIKEDTTDGILNAIQRGGGFRQVVQS